MKFLITMAMFLAPSAWGEITPFNTPNASGLSGTVNCVGSSVNIDGGTEYIDCTNNLVGIGDTSPDARLEVLSAQGSGGFVLAVSSQNDTVGNMLSVLGDGNVGIGTSAPALLLDVVGGAQFGSGVLKSTFAATPAAGTYALALSSGISISTGGVRFADGTIQYTVASSSLSPSGNNVFTGNNAFTAPTRGANGTSGSPMYSFSSDSNTGMNSDGNGVIQFINDGAISVSFGTSEPTRILRSGSITTDLSLESDDGNTRILFGEDAFFRIGSQDRMYIDTDGRVGIGTTNPATGSRLQIQNGSFFVGPSSLTVLSNNVGVNDATPDASLEVVSDKGSGGYVLAISSQSDTLGGILSVLGSGDVGIGNTAPAARFIVSSPAVQTISAGNTIAADACGTIKKITASGAVTTDTTNTFTAPAAANDSCCMDVIHVGTANNITLDANANFNAAADVVMTPCDVIRVCSDGTDWFPIDALVANTCN